MADIDALRNHVERARLIERDFHTTLSHLRGIANRLDTCLHEAELVLARLDAAKATS